MRWLLTDQCAFRKEKRQRPELEETVVDGNPQFTRLPHLEEAKQTCTSVASVIENQWPGEPMSTWLDVMAFSAIAAMGQITGQDF